MGLGRTDRQAALLPSVPSRIPGPSRASSLLLSRRWSSWDVSAGPTLDLYNHYVNRVNENEAELRERRKLLCRTADGKARTRKIKATYQQNFNGTSALISEWSREKFKEWRRRHPFRDLEDEDDRVPEMAADGEHSLSSQGRSAPASALTRKVSRLSMRSRESFTRMRSQSSLSLLSDHAVEDEKNKHKTVKTFWWYCRVIKAVCKLGLDMQRLSRRKTEQTALSELYYVSVSGPPAGDGEDNQIVFFDKSLFSRKRASCRVPEWAQNLMIRRPEDRKPEDVQRLKQLLMGMRSFREKYSDDMRTKISQVVRYTRCDKGRVILRQGHVGHYFYFIFSGSVFIQIDLYDARTGQTTPSTENVIRTGESFGEIALLGDGIRSASAICREPTELCQIDKSTFLEICPALFQEQLEEKILFAKGFEIFSDWQEEQLKQLCFLSQVLYVPHGRVLELDWARAQYVYYVIKGRIAMIKEFDVTDEGLDGQADDQEEDYDWKEEQKREEEEERYNVLAALVTSMQGVQLSQHKALASSKRYACVGTLRTGQTTDLRILSLNNMTVPSITLLSEGVRVLRIAVRNFYRCAPIRIVEHYIKRRYVPHGIPSTKAIVKRYTNDLSWKTYRKRVVETLKRELTGQTLVVNVAATAKGSTGWSRWPGFDPLAEEKSIVLSERGGRSEPEDYLQAMTNPLALRRRTKRKKTGKPVLRRSVTIASGSSLKSPVGPANVTVNERALIMYPPVKRHTAFLRRGVLHKSNTE